MILAAVFLLSLSSLSFEVLLARVFSISQWNHLSFMVISIALFGFGASGAFLSLLGLRKEGWAHRLCATGSVAVLILLYALAAIGSFIVLNQIPLDYFRLPLEPVQTLYLLTAYLLLSLPFFFSGLVLSLAYAYLSEKTGRIYFASMTGSACGAILPIPFLPLLGEGRLILLAAIIPLILIPLAKSKPAETHHLQKTTSRGKWAILQAVSLGIACVSAVLVTPIGSAFVEVKPSPYKALSQVLQLPDSRIIETAADLTGKIDSVKSPYIRFAPGLSLTFAGALPLQQAVFRDGDSPVTLYDLSSLKETMFAKFSLSYAGYLLVPNPENVLVIQHGGGSGIVSAVASGTREIIVAEQNSHISRIIRNHYHLPVVNQNPRTYLAKSNKRFDIIHVENWGASLPGAGALNQEYLLTIDAFIDYLRHLTEKGILIISRKILLPPSDSVRLWATAYESLRALGVNRPEDHLAILRNWDAFTLLVSAQPLAAPELIKDFARKKNFDIVYLRGLFPEAANRFNVFDRPYHFLEISRLAKAYQSGTEKTFFQSYLLDIKPQTDNRPFPGRFLKWFRLKELYQTTGSRLYSLFMSGEVVIAVVFFEALLVAILLLVLPLLFISKGKKGPTIYQVLFFLGVGAGFIFTELFFIKEYMLLFGDPVISLTVVLFGICVFSGIGGYWSQRIGHRGFRNAVIVLIFCLALSFLLFDSLAHRMLRLSDFLRYPLALLFLLPTGFLLGIPFPLGMRYLLKTPVQRAYAWSANGCASVLGSILSAQIAISLGVSAIMAGAILAYSMAFLSVKRR